MVGDPALAHACDDDEVLGRRVFRYVYDNDIVPQVPPKGCGSFAHFGQEFRYTREDGRWSRSRTARKQLRRVWDVLEGPVSFLSQQFPVTRDLLHFHASLYDHLPTGYITALTPEGLSNEFDRFSPRATVHR